MVLQPDWAIAFRVDHARSESMSGAMKDFLIVMNHHPVEADLDSRQ